MTRSYDFHPGAEIDLDEIWEFISHQNIIAADRVIGDIEKSLENLALFPHI